jgi:hypothetical protein
MLLIKLHLQLYRRSISHITVPCFSSPSLVANGYGGLFRKGESGRVVKLTTHLNLETRSRMVEQYLHTPIGLQRVVLNLLSTGKVYRYFILALATSHFMLLILKTVTRPRACFTTVDLL